MDVVIPFVNCTDKNWLKSMLSKYDHKYFKIRQFFDYGTLRYVLRGIDKHMDVDNVFLVVSEASQVPEYIDTSKVKVILHKDFIPEEFLPLFNCNIIEMFLHKIPGLGSEFIYFNDDMIPVRDIRYDDLFCDGFPRIKFKVNDVNPEWMSSRIFDISFYEGKNTAEIISGHSIEYSGKSLCPVHGPSAMSRPMMEEISRIDRHNSLLAFYLSKFRSSRNLNQYYWSDVLYFLGKCRESSLDVKYITTVDIDGLEINDLKDYAYLCINDYGTDIHPYSYIIDIVKDKLEVILSEKCKYEK